MSNYVCVLCGYRYRVEKGDVENGSISLKALKKAKEENRE